MLLKGQQFRKLYLCIVIQLLYNKHNVSSDEIITPYIFVGKCDVFVQSVNWSTPVEYILIITRYRHDEI